MSENLFTQEEIHLILLEAESAYYHSTYFWNIAFKKTSVLNVSKESGLILAQGNKSTGYVHIYERHSLVSRIPYWIHSEQLDNQSKFPLFLAPVGYITIASQIFNKVSKNIIKNKRPEIFDLYIGFCTHPDKTEFEYTLLTYKGTGLIHSFFLSDSKKPFNKKKVLNLAQGWSYGHHDYMNCIQTMNIPYRDANEISRFIVIIRHYEVLKLEKWYIQMNSDKGDPIVTIFIKEMIQRGKVDLSTKSFQVDFSDITWVEKIIKKIIVNEFVLPEKS